MRNITKRVAGLEQHRRRTAIVGGDAKVKADLERLMADDAGRNAAIDLMQYIDRRHPHWADDTGALRADPRVSELVGAVAAQATRLNAAWWLAGPP